MNISRSNTLTAELVRGDALGVTACLQRLVIMAAALAIMVGGRTAPAQARPQNLPQAASGATTATGGSDQDAPKPRPEFNDDEDGSKLLQRMEWFYGPRKYPLGHLPPRGRLNALQQKAAKDALAAAGRRPAGRRLITQPAWTSDGPQPINESIFGEGPATGRTTALAIDPTNTQVIYAGAAEGGVWKTTNGGTTWTPLTDAQMSLATGSITIDPENHNTIYVGTGEANFSVDSYYGAGVLKSTDGGATWTLNQGPFGLGDQCSNASIGAIAVQPTNSNVVLAGTEYCGLFRSADGGVTWSQPATAPNNIAGNSIIFDPANPTTVYGSFGYIFGGGTPGIYKSADSGVTWVLMNGSGSTVLPAGGRETLALAASSSSTLYVGIQDPSNLGNLLGLYKSTDGANTWAQLTNTPDYCTPQCWYDSPLAVSPVNPSVIYAGGGGDSPIYVSLDGGVTWNQQRDNSEIHVDEHAFAFTADGSTLYCAGDGGVWVTTNPTGATVTWTSLNSTFATAEYYPGLSINPSNVNNTFAGTQDNYTEQYTGSPEWTIITPCGDGGATAIDFVNPLNIYVNCIELSLYKSTDGGNTFSQMTNGFNFSDSTAWTPPLVMDPENSATLYFGTNFAYQTTNGAGLWTAISPDITKGNGDNLSALAVAPSDSNTVYSGSNQGALNVTRNATAGVGASWSNIGSVTELPNRAITAIAVDPTHPTTAYYTYSGFNDSFGHVFMTTNAGVSWTDISGDLPNTPVDSILIDPDVPGTIFIGTDIGAFYTSATGGSWSTLGTGLPNVVVTGLALYNSTRTLRASTHGRAMWDLNIASLLPVPTIAFLAPPSAIAGGSSFTLTVNGDEFDSQSVVEWNGAGLTTTFVSASEVTATVPASDIALAAAVSVSVLNVDSGESSNIVTFDVDNPVPSASSLSPPSVLLGSGQFTLTVNGSDFVTTSVVQWNGAALTTTFVNSGEVTAVVPASDVVKAGTEMVTAMNPAPGGGTSGALTFTIDNPAPSAISLSPSSATEGGAQFTLTVNGSGFIASSSVQWNGSGLTTTFVNGGQLTAVVPASDIANAGTVPVTVKNPSPGGGTSNALTFTINNPVPAATTIAPNSATAGGAALTLTVNGSNFVGTSAVQWNGSPRTTTFVSSHKVTAKITAADIALAGTFPVAVLNPGPGGGTSNSLTFTVNNPRPTATSLSPSSTTAGGPAFTLTVTGTNFVSTSVVNWNGSSRTSTFVNATKVTAMITAADIATAGTAKVTVTNPAPGGGTSSQLTFTIDNPVPRAISLSPSSANAGGPQFTLTVNGTGFVATSSVHWNSGSLTTIFVNSGQLTATVPANDIANAGTASVTVVNPSPGGGTSNALTFTINASTPTITSIQPNNATAGGSAVTLTVNGTNFASTSMVQWNGSARTTTFVSNRKVTAMITVADIALAGTFPVTVMNPGGGGTSNAVTFTVDNPKPTATALSPSSTTAGGAAFTLTVTGTNFVSTSIVNWNGSSRTSTFVNATKVTAMITAADIATAGTAMVTVTNPAPGGGTSAPLTFTIDNPIPTTKSLSPPSATAGGGSFTLTVNGTNFVAKSQVQWNGSNRTTTFVSDTEITATITAADIATAGTASVTVVNPSPGGGTSNAQTFTIDNPVAALTKLTPSNTEHGGAAFTLIVAGTGFVSTSQVQWNGSNRTTTFVSKTQVKAAITAADIATAQVTVVNPSPGGGTSNALTFTIN